MSRVLWAIRRELLLILSILILSSPFLFADGKALYEKKCSQCHGIEGKGDGFAAEFVSPKPRDFTLGTYKIRTTASGELPLDKDLVRTISQGIPGTSMPAFEKALSKSEIEEMIRYIKSLFPKFQEAKPEAVKIGGVPRRSKELVEKGKELYNQFRCFECHGTAGRADGPSAPTLKDEKGDPILPADFTKPWQFRGGGEVKDIFTRLTTGLNGTPMPAFTGIFPDVKEDERSRWALSHYIKSLSDGHPNFKSVIAAQYYAGDLSLNSSASLPWNDAEEVDLPLEGQVIQEPRLFIPAIDLVSVAAFYKEQELLLRIRWNDRTGHAQLKQGKDSLPDSLSLQFPLERTAVAELPYFLGGSESKPVQMLTWSSNFDKIDKKICKGLNALENAPTSAEGKANFDQGQWTLFLHLPLNLKEFDFKTGEFVPISFSAGDGSNGEAGAKRSVSAWVNLVLQQSPSKMRWVWPSFGFVGALGGEMILLSLARKRRKQ